MAVQIRGPKNSWIRFGILEVPYSEIPEDALAAYWIWHDRDSAAEDLEVPLPLDWSGA